MVRARKPVNCLMPLHASATNIWTPPGSVILFPSHRTGTPVAFITVDATRLASNWSGEAILRIKSDRQGNHEDQEEKARTSIACRAAVPQSNVNKPGQADQERDVAQERDRQRDRHQPHQPGRRRAAAPPSHDPPRIGTRPATRDLVGEVQADQRDQKTMAVVLVGRPGVVEVIEVVPEHPHEQPQTDRAPAHQARSAGFAADREISLKRLQGSGR